MSDKLGQQQQKLETWIGHVISTAMFGINTGYFMTNIDKTTFLEPDIAQLANSFGFTLSALCLFVTFFSALSTTGLFSSDGEFLSGWVAMEQRIRDTTLLVLFSLISLGSGMDSSDAFAVLSMVTIFIGRQTNKYFDLGVIIQEQDGNEQDQVTWVQNGLAMLMFSTATGFEIVENNTVGIVEYIIGTAAIIQLILLISKRVDSSYNQRRTVFEETVGSIFHFIVLGSLLSRVTQHRQLVSVAAVVIGDAAARVQRKYETLDGGSSDARGWHLFITRVTSTVISLVVAACSVALFEEKDMSEKDQTLATLTMIAGVLKGLNCLAFLLDSRKEAYKSVYNFISNGSTSLLLVASSIMLVASIEDPNVLTVVLFTGGLISRIVDMVQNAYASGAEVAKDEILASSMESSLPLEKAGYTNFRTWLVFFMLIGSTLYTYMGIVDICPSFIFQECTLSDQDTGIAGAYFFIGALHTLLLIVAFIVSKVDGAPSYLALSTVELARIIVSTVVIVLGSFVLGISSNQSLVISFSFYLLADGLGMSHA